MEARKDRAVRVRDKPSLKRFFFQSRATECPLPFHLTTRSSMQKCGLHSTSHSPHARPRITDNTSTCAQRNCLSDATPFEPLNLHALQARCGPSVQTLFVPFLTLLECTHFYTVRVPRKVNKTRNSISRVTPRNQQNIP